MEILAPGLQLFPLASRYRWRSQHLLRSHRLHRDRILDLECGWYHFFL